MFSADRAGKKIPVVDSGFVHARSYGALLFSGQRCAARERALSERRRV